MSRQLKRLSLGSGAANPATITPISPGPTLPSPRAKQSRPSKALRLLTDTPTDTASAANPSLSIDFSDYTEDIYELIEDGIYYPESDGKPMVGADWQAETLCLLVGNLKLLLKDAYVAMDIFWYPVQKVPSIVASPDLLVAFGRSPERRSSYRQWNEDNIPPHVVFEIQSPGNKQQEMAAKLKFYEKYGVQEYYVYYAKKEVMQGYIRQGDNLIEIDNMDGWQSPLMKIWFRKEITVNGRRRKVNWHFFLPNGEPFQTHGDAILLANDEKLRRQLAETERAAALAREALARQQAKLERQQRNIAEAREAFAQQQAKLERQQREAAEAREVFAQQQAEIARQQTNLERQQRNVAEAREAFAQQQTELERQQREAAEARETAERQQREAAEAMLTAMAAKLQAMGVNPDDILKS
jgi:Putative restriction endonuclease